MHIRAGMLRHPGIAAFAIASIAALPAHAQSEIEKAQEALKRANEALLKAEQSVDSARDAYREASNALRVAIAASGGPAPTPPAPQPVASADKKPVTEATARINGEWVTKKCEDLASAEMANLYPNHFQGCLDLRKWKDFPPDELNAQITASSDSTIDIKPSYTVRSGWSGSGRNNDYIKFSLGISAKLDEDSGNADFADLSDFAIDKGVKYTAGVQFGIGGRQKGLEDDLASAIAEAKQDCRKHHAGDPVPNPENPDGLTLDALCSGQRLMTFMQHKDRKVGYYRSIVKPVWGYDSDPRYFFGIDGSYSKPEYGFFPFADPAGTGIPLITALPAGFPEGKQKVSRSLFSANGYVGMNGKDIGGAIGVGYARSVIRLSDYKGISLCPSAPSPATPAYLKCGEVDIAPPYFSQGWSLNGRLAYQLPRFLFLPSIGVEAKVHYRFDIEQWGVEVPIRFLFDDEGKATAGVLVGCTGNGRTSNDFKIEGDCKASLFVGSKFSLTGKP
ncbi:hypothetical protein P6144_09775 [Sphingomonas sp. HITSZ_GF]|uniref:hypothetical protein n=1 Tax=Sphingomonas sp. HITSZ_GF TaxID=3037247 RepID=UPI00240DBF56|nr:hypothetical protein [Sphingomonas sp. HITSZ_GF]MDG2533934.1 hypothetical protein [Sphingomonas sp. HITSZ_GF]